MAKKISETISGEMELLRSEIKVIQEDEDATEEDLERADVLLDEWKDKSEARDKALAREAQVDEVLRASLNPGNREGGDGTVRRSVEVMRRVEPFDEQNHEYLSRSLYSGGSYDEKDTVSRALAAVERSPRYVSDAAKERMTDLLELDNTHAALIARHMVLTGSPEYHEQFKMYMKSRGTRVGDLLRDAMSLTDTQGGFLVPFTLDPTIILTNAGVVDPIRSISHTVTIATDSWNGVSSAGVSAEWTAEGTEAADASPTFSQPSIPVHKADAWVVGSYEVLADSGFSGQLGRLMADAKSRLEGAAFATGNTGATKPRGVVAAIAAVTTSLVGSAATDAFAVGDVYNVSDALRPRDASQATWIANKKIFSKIRQFDTAGGGSFWANLGMNQPNQLLSQPVYEASSMTGTIASAAYILLVGNFQEYYIVDRVGMSIMYDPMVKGITNGRPTGQAGYYAFWRVGADVVDPDAFRLLQLNAAVAATALA